MSFETRSSKKFIKTFEGSFIIEVPEGTPGANSRTNKVGRTVTFLQFNRITANINAVNVREHEFQGKPIRSLSIEMYSSKESNFNLDFHFNSGLTTAFFQTMEGIDVNKDVTLDIGRNKEGRDWLGVSQVNAAGNLERIEWRYTKEHPNGKPDWAQKKDAFGKIVWDNTEETAFFLRKLEVFRERLSATRHKEMSASVFTDDDFPSASDEPYFPPEEGYDDLPY